jgi:hypothetical protein
MSGPPLLLVLLVWGCQGPPQQEVTADPFAGYGCEGQPDAAGLLSFHGDKDGDGHGDPAAAVQACIQPPGHSHRAGDCDDQRADIHPGATERCNGRDDDCDGLIDEDDAVDAVLWLADGDGDGYPNLQRPRQACAPGDGWVLPGSEPDCDDREASIHPGAAERCNGVDDDCDGVIDGDNAVDMLSWYRDADGDGFGEPRHGLVACEASPGWVEPAARADCDDQRADVHPDATELCNGVDDDCDGQTDEDDAYDAVPWYADTDGDRFGDPSISVLSCRPPAGYVSSPGDCDDLRASAFLGGTELCNGVDDNCDGRVDEPEALDAKIFYRDLDADGFGDPDQPTAACRKPRGYRSTAGDCDDSRPDANPHATEVCNGRDDDCDGAIDEPDADDVITWFADADRDGFGDPSVTVDACYQPSGHVSPGGDCDDADASVHPEARELPDGIDNDCDRIIDEPSPEG